MAKGILRTRTRRQEMPRVSPAVVAGMLLAGELAAFALTAGQATIVLRSLLVAIPLLFFIARSPVTGVYAITFLIPLELFARIPGEFFSLYKLLGLFTLTAALVHAAGGPAPAVRWQKTALHAWIFAFLFFVGCSALWSVEVALSLQAARRLLSLAIFYFLVIRLVDSRDKLRALLLVIVLASAVGAVFAIYAYVRGQAVFDTQIEVEVAGKLRASGLSLDANFFAATILTALPICLLMPLVEKRGGIRALLGVVALLIVLGTIYSFSRGGALTMGVVVLLAFGALLLRLKGRQLGGALGAAAVIFLVSLAFVPQSYFERVQSLTEPMRGDESIRGRWLYVQFGREAVLDTPLGTGAGTFPVAFRQSRFNQMYTYYDSEQGERQGRSAHNMYLEVAVESGLLGGLLFSMIVLFALYENVRTSRHLAGKDEGLLLASNQSLGIALASFAFAGLFLSAQYEKVLWLLLACVPVLKNLAYEGEIVVPNVRKLRRALARRGAAA